MTTTPHGAEPIRIFVVDRREGRTLVLIADDDASFDVPASRLPKACRTEGAVLRVPIGVDDAPQWADAIRDREEEARRLANLEKRIRRLRRSDPGGDVIL